MTFISYAQNFEDVMLWRALKHVTPGFYIDLGAQEHETDSVTKAFYEKGWSGINVEPQITYYKKLEEFRSRDINLCLAISDTDGTFTFNEVGVSGLSTLDQSFAQLHKTSGWDVSTRVVECITLATLWKRHVPGNQDVHFLKIDIEGSEHSALKGNDWKSNRPWIVLLEATLPLSQTENHMEWEPTILDAGYVFVYADGLNRFYVAKEKFDSLIAAFKYPPNVFDQFKLLRQVEVESKLHLAERRLRELTAPSVLKRQLVRIWQMLPVRLQKIIEPAADLIDRSVR